MDKVNPFRVLSLDGGGMRGLYTAAVLSTLAQRYGRGRQLDVGKGFDLIAGTSTGGILACALVAGVPIEKVIDLYRRNGPEIFVDPLPRGPLRKFWWGLRNLFSPANENCQLECSLNKIFGVKKVGEVYSERGVGFCLPSVNLSTHESRVFKTAHDSKRNADDERTIVDVCLATSAAPIILPIAAVANPSVAGQLSHYVDGGLWANNPILVGLMEALSIAQSSQPIELISIGTCPPPSGGAILPKEARRGVFGWNFGVRALELSMDAQASGHQFMAKLLVEHLQKCGRKVTLLRLDQSSPSSEQAIHLGLDNASERACSTLVELGNSDGLAIYGKSLESNGSYQVLKSIFDGMPILQ